LSVLFTAVHKGPYLSIQPLEEELVPEQQVIYLVEGASRQERLKRRLHYFDLLKIESDWKNLEHFLHSSGIKAVIRSSSENVEERNPEDLASVAASNLGLPVFVVEDFPGNYWFKPNQRLDGLFVEGDSLTTLHQSRGIEPKAIHNTGNPRYDALLHLDTDLIRHTARQALGLSDEPTMLWAGQPDGDNSFQALERILSRFTSPNTVLLFRAHPRDPAYNLGKYTSLMTNTSPRVLDVSSYPNVTDLYCASDLIITQFSSAGVEAGYLGVPALFVLFNDLGKEYLRSLKGYDSLPWCEEGCAFLLEREEEVSNILNTALFNTSSRKHIISGFQSRFGADRDSARLIARQIRAVMGQIDQEATISGT
jgi:UDP-N-acetylglucosamine:LPS N-acetylglucosamine transferase